jgi:hypothetical protein
MIPRYPSGCHSARRPRAQAVATSQSIKSVGLDFALAKVRSGAHYGLKSDIVPSRRL